MKTIKIKINLYSPRELWVKFWNRCFWPRRKQCAEWMDLAQVKLEHSIIHDIIIDFYDTGKLDSTPFDAESLELAIKSAIDDVCEDLKKVICKPLD